MARSLVMCPATESLELIEFAKSPLGVLIHSCSRFRPATSLACARACALDGRCDLGASESAFVDDDVDTDVDIDIDIDIDVDIDIDIDVIAMLGSAKPVAETP